MRHTQTEKFLHAQTDQDNNDNTYFLFNTGIARHKRSCMHRCNIENNDKASFLSNTGHTQTQKVLHAQTDQEKKNEA